MLSIIWTEHVSNEMGNGNNEHFYLEAKNSLTITQSHNEEKRLREPNTHVADSRQDRAMAKIRHSDLSTYRKHLVSVIKNERNSKKYHIQVLK